MFSRQSAQSHKQLLTRWGLAEASERYRGFRVDPLSYGTVRDFCDSFDYLRPLATAAGDLKDLQRPWMLKAMLANLRAPQCRLLEIGAGEPLVADLLRRCGHEVWVVDPYDGSGNGPEDFARFQRRYRALKFVRDVFTDDLDRLEPDSFDCIYSISVLEHVPRPELARVFAGIQRYLKQDGLTLHAVDHVHRGVGAEAHLAGLRSVAGACGLSDLDLQHTLTAMAADTDTYYLSAESHNRWRGGLAYDQFPMRTCVSMQFCSPATSIAPERATPSR